MKKILLFVAFSFIWTWSASAIQFLSDDVVQINSVVDETVMAAWSDINVNAEIDGDLFLAGQQISVTWSVTEDTWLAWNAITISAELQDDLRAAWNMITINNNVAGDAMLAGNTVTTSGEIGWDVFIWWANVRVTWNIWDDLTIDSDTLYLDSSVAGNATITSTNVTFGENATIAWNLEISEKSELYGTALSWIVAGTVTYTTWSEHKKHMWNNHEHEERHWFDFNTYKFLVLTILWALMLWFMPNYTQKATQNITNQPGKTFLYGLLIIICTPLVAMLLMFTWIGAPLWWWLLANYIFLWVFLWIFVGVFWTEFIMQKWGYKHLGNEFWKKCIVLIILSLIITVIPYFITFLLWLFALGTGYMNDSKIIKENV